MNRFDNFTEQERALIMVGLTGLFAEYTIGAITGTPAAPVVVLRDGPPLMTMMSEISEASGSAPIDPELRAAFVSVMDQRAAAEKEHGR